MNRRVEWRTVHEMSTALQPTRATPPPAPAAAPPTPAPDPRPAVSKPRRIALGAAALWLLTGVYVVPADEQAVITVFGAVSRERVMPGLHLTWPYPIAEAHKLKVRQLRRSVIGGDPADAVLGRVEPLQSQFLTGDRNVIHVRTVVQYSVATPRDYLFQVADPAAAVGAAVEAELGRGIASRTVDDVLTTEKVALQEAVRLGAQQRVDAYQLGVILSTVNIERVSPPPEAADAFRDVAGSRADAARIVSEAQGYANDLLPRARGEASQMIEAALAYRERKINEAGGDTARFTQLAREYVKNPEVTRTRLYIETLEEVLPRLNKTIVDDRGNLDLTIIRRGTKKTAPPGR